MDRFAAPDRPPVPAVRLLRRRRCRARDRADGLGAETARETIDYLNGRGAKLGRGAGAPVPAVLGASICWTPSPAPSTAIAVLDRTQGARRVRRAALSGRGDGIRRGGRRRPAAPMPRIVGGRYGLASKEFTPAMVKAVFDNLASARRRTTSPIGINDDVSHTSLEYDREFVTEADDVVGCIFYGLGADGTVGANKNSIKIIGEETAGLRAGLLRLRLEEVRVADDVAPPLRAAADPIDLPRPARPVHRLPSIPVRRAHRHARRGDRRCGVPAQQPVRLRTRSGTSCRATMQEDLIRKHIRLYVIDADAVAVEAGMAGRINTIMQTCFFAISGVLPRDEAIARIKDAIEATYGAKGRNWSRATSPPSTARSRTCTKSRCRPRRRARASRLPLVPAACARRSSDRSRP